MIYKIEKGSRRNNYRLLHGTTIRCITNEVISAFYDNSIYEYVKLLFIPKPDQKREIAKLRYHAKKCGYNISIKTSGDVVRISFTEIIK